MAKAPVKAGKKKSFKKKEKRVVHSGIVHIQATFNNTIVTIADLEGNTIAWSSAGSLGFRGSRKGTPFAAQQAAMTAANKANESGLRTVVAFESPHRIDACLADLEGLWGGRPIALARELTKAFEEVLRGTAVEVRAALTADRRRGEMVLVLGGRVRGADEEERS